MSDELLQKMECFILTTPSLSRTHVIWGINIYVMSLSSVNFIKHLGQDYPTSG